MKIKVTGYSLREAIRKWNLKRDTAAASFNDSLKKFKDETKPDPVKIVSDFYRADHTIALLQVAQDLYNLGINITITNAIGSEKMTLALAVKLLGGAGRREKMWRGVVAPKENPYGRDDVRQANEERAKATITRDQAQELAETAANFAGALRAAISTANATELEVEVEGLEAQALA